MTNNLKEIQIEFKIKLFRLNSIKCMMSKFKATHIFITTKKYNEYFCCDI